MSAVKSKSPKSEVLTKDGCKRCAAFTKAGVRCRNKASCDLKCTKFCRIHSPGYDDGNEVCARPSVRREAKKPGRKPAKKTSTTKPGAKKSTTKKVVSKKAVSKKATSKKVVLKKAVASKKKVSTAKSLK